MNPIALRQKAHAGDEARKPGRSARRHRQGRGSIVRPPPAADQCEVFKEFEPWERYALMPTKSATKIYTDPANAAIRDRARYDHIVFLVAQMFGRQAFTA
jgi:hypothetical protein